jgi:hypothetical protein
MNKTFRVWELTKQWCEQNPGKLAAVVTPRGMFTITFKESPHKPPHGAIEAVWNESLTPLE